MWKPSLVFAGVLSSAALVLADLPSSPERPSETVSHEAPSETLALSAARSVGRLPDAASEAEQADPQNPWPRFTTPAEGPAQAIGSYAAGCVQGALALPLDGPGYQVMRPSSRRYYGHPELVSFVQRLGQRVHDGGLGVLLVGDMSQPRGGRTAGGHASHQSGLDVDVWFWRPEQALREPLPQGLRETLEAPSVLDARGEAVDAPYKSLVASVLKITAEDPSVERVFVHASIKRELCASVTGERGWLRKVRPFHGHDDHFHARLKCPASDAACKAQAPLPQGDGCDQLGFWFSDRAQAARRQAMLEYARNVHAGRRWPQRCDKLL